jgi:hypothetical protein
MISPEMIDRALDGIWPPLGHAISAGELGSRLGPHRRGRFPGRSFTKQAISLYRREPGQQSEDFGEAFVSWTAAEVARQEHLRVRLNGLWVDELLAETGYVQQVGDGQGKTLVLVGELPEGMLIRVNGTAQAVECAAEIGLCGCGQLFVRRSWNHRCCRRCRGARGRHGI